MITTSQPTLLNRPVRVPNMPLTYNGKLQHAQLRADYLAGDLARRGDILYPDAS